MDDFKSIELKVSTFRKTKSPIIFGQKSNSGHSVDFEELCGQR